MSTWVEDEPYIIPEKYSLDVILPNGVKTTIEVNTKSSTRLSAEDLNLDRFKDGIYEFEISPTSETSGGCGIYRKKITGIFPRLECCLDSAYYDLSLDKYEDLRKIDLWLNNAKMSASLGIKNKAEEEWNVAKKLLGKLNCECK
jgi:hypothetical protein